MKNLSEHGLVFLVLIAITYAAFGYLTTSPLWDRLDYDILCDADAQSQNVSTMVRHIGFYFSQPLLQLTFLLELRLFGTDPSGYIAVNLFVHACNAFVVYMLVNMLFPLRQMALLAAILFAFGVGSYGKTLMTIHQLESLLLAWLHLVVLYCFIRNDFRREGGVLSLWFLLGLALYLATGLTKAASFSLIGTLIAYKIFFFKWRNGRAILSPDILVLAATGIAFYWGQGQWGYAVHDALSESRTFDTFSWISFKNIFRYLNLMFFPMQQSPVLENANAMVRGIYEARTLIRTFITLSIVSFSFFGFVFGSKTIRFFIAWTYITLLPFTGHNPAGDWLNLAHLYLTSLGFCVVLAAGTTGCSKLLQIHRWRRYAPYVVPLAFVALSVGLTFKLDAQHRAFARSDRGQELHAALEAGCGPSDKDRPAPAPSPPSP